MPRVQVYLPDDLYALLKERGMSASQLLQDAIREEERKRELCAALDDYLAEMDELYGPASPEEQAEAKEWAARVAAAVRQAANDEAPVVEPAAHGEPASDDEAMPSAGQATGRKPGPAARRRRAG
jgi:hypothetical protein